VRHAERPRINTIIATSDIHLRHKLFVRRHWDGVRCAFESCWQVPRRKRLVKVLSIPGCKIGLRLDIGKERRNEHPAHSH
jgi:hypothetical protein